MKIVLNNDGIVNLNKAGINFIDQNVDDNMNVLKSDEIPLNDFDRFIEENKLHIENEVYLFFENYLVGWIVK